MGVTLQSGDGLVRSNIGHLSNRMDRQRLD